MCTTVHNSYKETLELWCIKWLQMTTAKAAVSKSASGSTIMNDYSEEEQVTHLHIPNFIFCCTPNKIIRYTLQIRH